MLVITRFPGQSLTIGAATVIVGNRGPKDPPNTVRLLIDAPPDVQVTRDDATKRYPIQRRKAERDVEAVQRRITAAGGPFPFYRQNGGTLPRDAWELAGYPLLPPAR